VKYDWLDRFAADWARLSDEERTLFVQVVRTESNAACERFARGPSTPWPKGLRVKRLQGVPGVWEMTWSFAGPDGRATFEWILIDGEPAVRWRRIGGHGVFDRP
jgi:hypothetical protein